ncbi:MAG: AsmA-like C-terminal region-containing protein, partial [Limnohabitans sp.]
LARETQDLQVLILPEVDAGTASLLAGLAVNPVVGLTSFLAQLFLRQPLRQANTQLYRIDGPWREPRITRLPLPAGGAVPAAPATSEAASGARP